MKALNVFSHIKSLKMTKFKVNTCCSIGLSKGEGCVETNINFTVSRLKYFGTKVTRSFFTFQVT
jgi:hypothetical protein